MSIKHTGEMPQEQQPERWPGITSNLQFQGPLSSPGFSTIPLHRVIRQENILRTLHQRMYPKTPRPPTTHAALLHNHITGTSLVPGPPFLGKQALSHPSLLCPILLTDTPLQPAGTQRPPRQFHEPQVFLR